MFILLIKKSHNKKLDTRENSKHKQKSFITSNYRKLWIQIFCFLYQIIIGLFSSRWSVSNFRTSKFSSKSFLLTGRSYIIILFREKRNLSLRSREYSRSCSQIRLPGGRQEHRPGGGGRYSRQGYQEHPEYLNPSTLDNRQFRQQEERLVKTKVPFFFDLMSPPFFPFTFGS